MDESAICGSAGCNAPALYPTTQVGGYCLEHCPQSQGREHIRAILEATAQVPEHNDDLQNIVDLLVDIMHWFDHPAWVVGTSWSEDPMPPEFFVVLAHAHSIYLTELVDELPPEHPAPDPVPSPQSVQPLAHCWLGFHDDNDVGYTCMLVDGHTGEHRVTPDSEGRVRFLG